MLEMVNASTISSHRMPYLITTLSLVEIYLLWPWRLLILGSYWHFPIQISSRETLLPRLNLAQFLDEPCNQWIVLWNLLFSLTRQRVLSRVSYFLDWQVAITSFGIQRFHLLWFLWNLVWIKLVIHWCFACYLASSFISFGISSFWVLLALLSQSLNWPLSLA